MNLGSGENGQFTFLDIIGITSFIVGLLNLEENLTQGDKQDLMNSLDEHIQSVLTEIHSHLDIQDEKINKILEAINDSR